MRLRTSLTALLSATAVAVTLTAATTSPANAAAIPKFKQPKVFGTSFQKDPKHDFTKRISPRHDGVLRGWITHHRGGIAEYEPIKWAKGKHTQGRFVGPPEGDVTRYASPISKNVAFYSSYGCRGGDGGVTVDNRGVGDKRCSRKEFFSRLKDRHPALITVYRGKIVKFQEIYVP
ncbi:hypothetical protein [Sphaerimonospora thailandensis]|uniref:LGFP repeat-containing protein n=1 Tax=Sphaerimonospora thailandensis TaxID=795644 RepID=A0A8J3VY18_9ACTN|nr:hypothetical protein [Sphaerimonospora thailandensis]GIH68523.1 hypothetical protein Mth01_07760 [Sphaerimonospora thailandensis]